MLDAYRLLHDGSLALARAERNGMRIDVEYIKKKKGELDVEINELTDKLYGSKFYKRWSHSVGRGRTVNINSNTQLSHHLYKRLRLKPAKLTDKGNPSTDEDALEALNIPELNDMLRMRKLRKIRDTYLDQFLREAVDGYIHPFFSLSRARTYRSSSDSPNFQNIPNRDAEAREIVRSSLFPRPGHQILEVDYGALEVRIAACYHKDPTMLEYITTGHDMHADMTKQIYKMPELVKDHPSYKLLRGGTKNGFVFPQFYGDYYKNNAIGLAKWVHLPTQGRWKPTDGIELPDGGNLAAHMIGIGMRRLTDFEEHLREIEDHFWNERFAVYSKWKKLWWRRYQKRGYFDMYTGFRCRGVMGRNDAVNYPIQGSAFHCLLWSFIQVDKLLHENKFDSRLIGQIHDSIILDVHPDEFQDVLALVHNITTVDLRTYWSWIIVPLEVEAEATGVDESWNNKKVVEIK